jgi:5-methylcytosine-specific restriction endonuclease McrA
MTTTATPVTCKKCGKITWGLTGPCPACGAPLPDFEKEFRRNEAKRQRREKERREQEQKQEQDRKQNKERQRAKLPPPDSCKGCGEARFILKSVSPTEKSAVYSCAYCGKEATSRDVAPREGRQPIPKSVQREVWQRDGGRCVECGSQLNLEFDHMVPVALGGSNTARNIQLLCEACNRRKSASSPGAY